jgi:hypothetical protein
MFFPPLPCKFAQQTPLHMATELYLQVNGSWRSILTIPNDDFNRFTTRPLAWLRFLGYAIYGRDGHLKTRPNGPQLDSYNTGVADLNRRYYYQSPGTWNSYHHCCKTHLFLCRCTSIYWSPSHQRQNIRRHTLNGYIANGLQTGSHRTWWILCYYWRHRRWLWRFLLSPSFERGPSVFLFYYWPIPPHIFT